jgi:hypothetical protein
LGEFSDITNVDGIDILHWGWSVRNSNLVLILFSSLVKGTVAETGNSSCRNIVALETTLDVLVETLHEVSDVNSWVSLGQLSSETNCAISEFFLENEHVHVL